MQQPREISVRTIRPFCMSGEPIPAGTTMTLESSFALELMAMNKAVEADAQAPAADVPVTARRRGRRSGASTTDQPGQEPQE